MSHGVNHSRPPDIYTHIIHLRRKNYIHRTLITNPGSYGSFQNSGALIQTQDKEDTQEMDTKFTETNIYGLADPLESASYMGILAS